MTRRVFGHLALLLPLIVYAAGFLCGALRFLSPLPAGRRKSRLEVGPVSEFETGKVERVVFNGRSIFVLAAEGKPLALDAKCTHLACNVNWDPELDRFVCPCHNGQFQRDGEVFREPPMHPLRRQKFVIEEGSVILLDDPEAGVS